MLAPLAPAIAAPLKEVISKVAEEEEKEEGKEEEEEEEKGGEEVEKEEKTSMLSGLTQIYKIHEGLSLLASLKIQSLSPPNSVIKGKLYSFI